MDTIYIYTSVLLEHIIQSLHYVYHLMVECFSKMGHNQSTQIQTSQMNLTKHSEIVKLHVCMVFN